MRKRRDKEDGTGHPRGWFEGKWGWNRYMMEGIGCRDALSPSSDEPTFRELAYRTLPKHEAAALMSLHAPPRVAPHGNAAPDDAPANVLWPRDFTLPTTDPDE